MSRFDIICIRYRLDIGCIIVAVLEYLLVRFDKFRLLLSELALKILEDVLHRTVVDIAGHTEGEHILAFSNCLSVKTTVLEALLRQGCDRSYDYGPVFNIKFSDRIVLETCSLETVFIKGIRINKNHSCSLKPFCIGFECCRIHRHEKIAEVSWSSDVLASDMNLEA